MIYFDLFESKNKVVYENCDEFLTLGDANLIWEPKLIWPVLDVKWGYGEHTIVSFYTNIDCYIPLKILPIKALWKQYFESENT